ncbi:hypothetical protein LINPERHAP2_LOCUS17122 [Linum perenne]
MTPSEELFDSLQSKLIWVKIIGMPFAFRTLAIGRKLLAPMGEVVRMGYFDAKKPDGSGWIYSVPSWELRLLTEMMVHPSRFFFQYEGVPRICYLCGFLGHVMGDCACTDVVFDPFVRDSWICGLTDPDDEESEGPGLQKLIPLGQQHRRGRGGLPPSIAAGLSSNLY